MVNKFKIMSHKEYLLDLIGKRMAHHNGAEPQEDKILDGFKYLWRSHEEEKQNGF